MQTLVGQGPITSNIGMIGTVSSRNKTVTRLACNGFGHVSEQCPTRNSFNNFKPTTQSIPKVCYFCQKPGHIACNCYFAKPRRDERQNNQGRDVPSSYRCDKEGDIARFCQAVLDGPNSKGSCTKPTKFD